MLTEKEAWLKLAECWMSVNSVSSGGIHHVPVNDSYCAGLCASISALHSEVSLLVTVLMRNKIKIERTLHVGGYGRFNTYIWPQTKEGAAMRVGFCRAMAEAIG